MPKSRRRLFWGLVVFILAMLAGPVLAAGGDRVTLEAGQVVNDDFYAAGRMIRIQGDVKGDLMAAGETVTGAGRTGSDVLAAGRFLDLGGSVGGDVRAAGQVINITANVDKAMTLFGQQLTLGPAARVGRNLIYAGENMDLDGTVGGNVRAWVNTAAVSGQVGGNLEVDATRLDVLPGARINGDIVLRGPNPPQIAPGAVVQGQVRYTTVAPETPARRTWWQVLGQQLLALIKLLALASLLALLAAPCLEALVKVLQQKPWSGLGAGLGWIVLAPLAIILLALVVVGQSVAGLLGLAYLALLFGAGLLFKPILGAFLGHWLLARFGGGRQLSLIWETLLGATILWLLGLIPVVGTIITILGVIFTLGSGLIWLGRHVLSLPHRAVAE